MDKYKTEEYRDPTDLKIRYALSVDEKKELADIIHAVLHRYRSPLETIPFVKSCIPKIIDLYNALDKFFVDNSGDYFLRTSNCSPKDAWYQLYSETPNLNEADEANNADTPITLEEIERDINVLKVNNAEQCILVLCHSERIYYDMEFDESDNAILLMTWRSDILLDTETRCFIKNKKLIGFSQYYCDFPNGYLSISNIIDMENFSKSVIDFINGLIFNNKVPYANAVVDIAVSKSIFNSDKEIFSSDDMIFIEINGFDRNTDSCLFEWDELLNENESVPVKFLYKRDGCLQQIHQ